MKKQLTGFMGFVRQHGVVGLAVGLAIGIQAGNVVNAIVAGLVDPLVGFIIGDTEGLSSASFYFSAGGRSMEIMWGSVVSSLITLSAVSALIYYVVMGLKLDKADKATDKDK